MSKVVVAIKEIGGVEQKRLLGVFDSTWRIFVETEPGNATELTPIDDKPETEFYQCKSYYDNNNQLQNCTCGKCGKKIEKLQPSYAGAVLVHSEGRLMWEKINELVEAFNSLKGE